MDRGYAATEDLYSAGFTEIELNPGESCDWIIAEDRNDLSEVITLHKRSRAKIFDFVLTRPAGIIAGLPWFGEWGRDTFISLPGIAASAIKLGNDPAGATTWTNEILHRWGTWIERSGMLPNIIEKDGQAQWESADATLWWCHSLASLWMFSLCPPHPFIEIQQEFTRLLNRAIDSIRSGKHRFLKENKKGLLEVTDPHATWMDARVDGAAVTPRMGVLPDINALWFQARCLQWIWSDLGDFSQIEDLGQSVLEIREEERPNMIFLHSIPLAPSFILQNWEKFEEDLLKIGETFWTPVGLRTLDPHHPNYQPSYIGIQKSRDTVYHQGPAWGWLGGQFEAARLRMLNHLDDLQPRTRAAKLASSESRASFNNYAHLFSNDFLQRMPIYGHIAELFDAENPYTPRGAPAQAWSLACLEEATTRFNLKVDLRLSRAVTQRNQVAAKGLKTKKRQTKSDKNISR